MARRGRKRKSLAIREKNGRIQRPKASEKKTVDKELETRLQNREKMMSFDPETPGDKPRWDPALSEEYPLDVLYARGKIDADMHLAGKRFGQLHNLLFPRSSSVMKWAGMIDNGDAPRGEPMSDEDRAAAEAHFATCVRALHKLPNPSQAISVIWNYAVHHTHDEYTKAVYLRQDGTNAHKRQLASIRMALQEIASIPRRRYEDLVNANGVILNALGVSSKGEPAVRVA